MANLKEVPMAVEHELSARIIRCACNAPQTHAGQVCPRGQIVDLGLLSYWHRNPIKRIIGRLKVHGRS
jgi:hypothetical protein